MAEYLTLYVTTEAETTVDVPCVPGMLSDADRLIEGGFEDRSAIVVLVRTGHFISADMTTITVDSDLFTADNSVPRPHAKKRCSFRGRTWKIESAGEDATRAYLRLAISPSNSR